jgi:hypothetical protein
LDYYGPLLDKVLRLAQVGSQEHLQPVHQALAENKKQARKVWQKFVDAAAAELGYQGLNIIISGGVANKLADSDVGTALFRDLSAGINLYQLGANTNANADAMRGNASAYDLAMSGATGDFHALFNVINSKSIELPMNFYMTESQLKMMHVLMYTMWGPAHTAVRECTTFMDKARRHHEVLIRYRPRAAHHENLTPVLVAQQWREVFNVWALDQQESPTPVAFYSDILQSMWPKLLMNDQTWEKAIDDRYLDIGRAPPLPLPAPVPSYTPSPAPARPAPAPGPSAERQTPHHNLHPNATLTAFKEKTGGQSMKAIVKNAKDAGNPVPKNDNGEEMCVTFHCMAVCNNNCSRRWDHNTLMQAQRPNCHAHNPGEDARLIAWCTAAFPVT